MKILVLSNLYPPDVIGGYELGCRQVVDALVNQGHDVRVLTTSPRTPAPPEPRVRRSFRLSDIYNIYVNQRMHMLLPFRMWEAEAHFVSAHNVHVLIEELRDFQPDVVYVWMTIGLGGLGLMGCLQYLKAPWVWHLMDCVPASLCQVRGRTIPELANLVSGRLDGKFLACSRQVVDEIEAMGVQLGDDVEVIPNWVTGPSPADRERYFRPGRDRLRIVSAGQVARHKGVDILIEAAKLLRDAGEERFSIDIYGHVVDSSFLTLVSKYGLQDLVTFKGSRSQDQLACLYGHYDVFAFPTWAREPFGFAPLEAATRNCVPVISHTCGISEWLAHDVHCLKVERTAEAFAETFREIISGEIDIEPIGRRIGPVVRRSFHLDTILPRIESALGEAALKSRDGGGDPADAYRMAVLAEKLTMVMTQEAVASDRQVLCA